MQKESFAKNCGGPEKKRGRFFSSVNFQLILFPLSFDGKFCALKNSLTRHWSSWNFSDYYKKIQSPAAQENILAFSEFSFIVVNPTKLAALCFAYQ